MDHMSEIENERGQIDFGTMAHRIFRGAREDGASRVTAYLIVAAWCRAMLEANPTTDESDE